MTHYDGCYGGMFMRCKKLTTLPQNLLPATTLAPHCYQYMFNVCTNLQIDTSGDESKKFFTCPSDITTPTGCVTGMFTNTKGHSSTYEPTADTSYYCA